LEANCVVFLKNIFEEMEKPKVVIEYAKLSPELLDLFDETFPTGVTGKTVRYPNSKGEIVTAVRLETESTSYLVKLSTRAKEVLSDEDLDALIRSSTKSKGDDEEEEAEEEEEEAEDDPRKASTDDED
jgi:Ran GTPase-activating protein (RanGAP) involved in mRNA processing and transport